MTYRITCSARASGQQYYTVEADSEEEALKKFEDGEGEFESEDLEVNFIEAQTVELIKH